MVSLKNHHSPKKRGTLKKPPMWFLFGRDPLKRNHTQEASAACFSSFLLAAEQGLSCKIQVYPDIGQASCLALSLKTFCLRIILDTDGLPFSGETIMQLGASLCLSLCLLVCFRVSVSIYFVISVFLCVSLCISVYPNLFLFGVCASLSLFVCLCLSVSWVVSVCLCLSLCVRVCCSSLFLCVFCCLFVYLRVSTFVYFVMSVYICLCLIFLFVCACFCGPACIARLCFTSLAFFRRGFPSCSLLISQRVIFPGSSLAGHVDHFGPNSFVAVVMGADEACDLLGPAHRWLRFC